MRICFASALIFLIACDSSSSNDAGRDARVDSEVDCSAVGCGFPPRCELGCTEACGCCTCGEGEVWDIGGEHRVCRGGCFALIEDAGVDAATDGGADSGAADSATGDSSMADSGAGDSATGDSAVWDSATVDGGGTDGAAGDAAVGSGETCADAIDVTAGVVLSAETTATAADDLSPPLGMGCPAGGAASGRDRVYFVEPGHDTPYRVTVTPEASFDPMLYLVRSCDFATGCIDGTVLNGPGVAESLTFTAPRVLRTYIIVDGEALSSGAYTLTVEPM